MIKSARWKPCIWLSVDYKKVNSSSLYFIFVKVILWLICKDFSAWEWFEYILFVILSVRNINFSGKWQIRVESGPCSQYSGMLACAQWTVMMWKWKATLCLSVYHHHHLSLNREGHWGTTDDFAISLLHFPILHCPLGLGELHTCLFPEVVFPPLPLFCKSQKFIMWKCGM